MRKYFPLIVAIISFFCFQNCSRGGSQGIPPLPSLFPLLEVFFSNPSPFIVGVLVDLDGDENFDGIPVDVDADGIIDGIDTDANQVPDLYLIDSNFDGRIDSIDTNGDSNPNYYFCIHSNLVRMTVSPNCSGHFISIIDSNGDSKPDGFDTNGDHLIDDPILATIQADFSSPTISIVQGNGPGTYKTRQQVKLICSDTVAAGGIVYTLDGSAPSFLPFNGIYKNSIATFVNVGDFGNGTYTFRYICRDAVGNESPLITNTYNIDSSGITVFAEPSTNYISGNPGAVSTSYVHWSANRAGNYTIRVESSGSCDAGTEIYSGTNSINSNINSPILASSHFTGEGSKNFTVYSYLDNNGNGVCDPFIDFVGAAGVNIIRDDTPPTVTTSIPAGNYMTAQTLSFFCSDLKSGCSKIYYKYATGTPPNDPTSADSIEFSPPTLTTADNEVNYFRYNAMDFAGNVSPVKEIALTVDTKTPSVSIQSATPYINASSNASIYWKADRNGTYDIRLQATSCTTGSSISTGSMTAGSYITTTIPNASLPDSINIVYICIKTLLRSNYSTVVVTRDTSPPTMSLDLISGNTYKSGVFLHAICSDPNGSGRGQILTTSDGLTVPSFNPPVGDDLPIGSFLILVGNNTHKISAICQDKAGNISNVATGVFYTIE